MRGGIERHTEQLAWGAAAAGHDVEVLTTAPHGPTTVTAEGPLRVVRARRWGEVASTPLSPALLAHLGERIRPGGADVVHSQFPYPPAELRWLLADARWPRGRTATVVSYHADVVRHRQLLRFYGPAVRRLLRRADAVVAGSEALVDSSPFLSRVRSRVTVIPFGADIGWLSRPTPPPPVIADAASRGPVVLFVGRLRWYKGVDVLIDAVGRLPTATQLAVVGDGPEAPRLQALASARALSDRVHFCGELPDHHMPGAYQAADVVVLPSTSRAEAFGLAQLEAMAAGTPVVSTAVGTGVEVVNEHGVTGLVVPPGDARALAAALADLLADDDRRQRLGRQAASRARRRFSMDSMVDRTLALYDDVLGRRAVSHGR